jgi:hypothetical protein
VGVTDGAVCVRAGQGGTGQKEAGRGVTEPEDGRGEHRYRGKEGEFGMVTRSSSHRRSPVRVERCPESQSVAYMENRLCITGRRRSQAVRLDATVHNFSENRVVTPAAMSLAAEIMQKVRDCH